MQDVFANTEADSQESNLLICERG